MTHPEDLVDVTVIGEALTDIIIRDEQCTSLPGGSPMNVAIGVSRLGSQVELVTRIGTDAHGRELKQHIAESDVNLFPGSIVEESTSTATAMLDGSGAARYEFKIRWSLEFVGRLPATRLIHTGSIAAFLYPGASDVRRLLAHAHESALITFDPNIRPALLGSVEETRPIAEELMAMSNVVKLSDEDAAWLYPDFTVEEVLHHILTLGPALAVITQGAAGAILMSAQARAALAGRQIVVADTIGAGDSFMSATIHILLTMIREGCSAADLADGSAFTTAALTRIGTFAIDCAAVTVSRPGANPPRLADMIT
jgi:fructokinase